MAGSQKLIVLFGLPGTGKTYVGKIFQEELGFFLYDADDDLTDQMKTAIANRKTFTDSMRIEFFDRVIERVRGLILKHPKLVVTQTFIQERYRQKFIANFPQVFFVFIETNNDLRESRLQKRIEYPLDIEYARSMCRIFEIPVLPHRVLNNNTSGKSSLSRQLAQIL